MSRIKICTVPDKISSLLTFYVDVPEKCVVVKQMQYNPENVMVVPERHFISWQLCLHEFNSKLHLMNCLNDIASVNLAMMLHK